MVSSKRTDKEQKLKEIKQLLAHLVCFTQEEVNEYQEATGKMFNEGLDAFIAFLKESKEEQDRFFAKRVEEDKQYPQKIKQFLKTTTNRIRREYEQTQKSEAEDILHELDND